MLSTLRWLFDYAKAREVYLNVGENLTVARALYEDVGFELRVAGIGMRGSRSSVMGER